MQTVAKKSEELIFDYLKTESNTHYINDNLKMFILNNKQELKFELKGIATVLRLIDRYGDIPLSESLENLKVDLLNLYSDSIR